MLNSYFSPIFSHLKFLFSYFFDPGSCLTPCIREITKAGCKKYGRMCYIPSKDWLVGVKDPFFSSTIEAICCNSGKIVFSEETKETNDLVYHPELNALIQCVVSAHSLIDRTKCEVRVVSLVNGRLVKKIDLINENDEVYEIVVSKGQIFVLFDRDGKIFLGRIGLKTDASRYNHFNLVSLTIIVVSCQAMSASC